MIARDVVLLYYSFLLFCSLLFLVGGLEMHFSSRHDTHHCFLLSHIYHLQHFKPAFRALTIFLFTFLLSTYLIDLSCHIHYGSEIEESCLTPIFIPLKMFY